MRLQEAIEVVKANDFLLFRMGELELPIPEPREGEIWVAPNPRIAPRVIAKQQTAWIIDFHTPDDALRGISREAFMAWARRTGARPVVEVLPVAVEATPEPQAAPVTGWRSWFGWTRR